MFQAFLWFMFSVFNSYSSLVSILYTHIINLFSYYYLLILGLVLVLFLSYRFPYGYRPLFFIFFLLIILFTCFISMLLMRVVGDFNLFFSSFIPVGTPLYICSLVCLAETISFIIRPFVLVFRPFINISLGCLGAVAVSRFCFTSWLWLIILVVLFFYEVFVALVHWFIVTNILAFSVDH